MASDIRINVSWQGDDFGKERRSISGATSVRKYIKNNFETSRFVNSGPSRTLLSSQLESAKNLFSFSDTTAQS